MDEVQPTFSNCLFTSTQNAQTGKLFKVAIHVASAMALATCSRPVDFQVWLRHAIVSKVGEELPFNLSEKNRSHSGCFAKVIHRDILSGGVQRPAPNSGQSSARPSARRVRANWWLGGGPVGAQQTVDVEVVGLATTHPITPQATLTHKPVALEQA